MSRVSSTYICQQCGFQSPTFLGKCPECGTWNSLIEQISEHKGGKRGIRTVREAEIINLTDIEKKYSNRLSSGIDEFDRVLGGGIVTGSVVLVSGDPGIGKSTLLTQLAITFPEALYVAGEESAHQIKLRTDRIKKDANLSLINETDIDMIIGAIEKMKPKIIIVDSIQALETEDLEAPAGSLSQVRECAYRLQKIAKKLHIPTFIIGHVTKEGFVAGPKTLEHMVDVVLSIEGDQFSQFRILRGSKNRFGPTDEVGIFEMDSGGIREVKNPSAVFLNSPSRNLAGSTITAVLTGLRIVLVEIQALVTKSNLSFPRRVGNGIDNNRLQLLVAVLSKRLNLPLFDKDIFVNITGGIKLSDTASDLAICMAIISSLKEITYSSKTVFIGEVGLLGELRSIREFNKRVTEAKRLGFKKIISFENAKSLFDALKLAKS